MPWNGPNTLNYKTSLEIISFESYFIYEQAKILYKSQVIMNLFVMK